MAAILTVAAFAAGAALAADGSGTDNTGLLRGGYSAVACTKAWCPPDAATPPPRPKSAPVVAASMPDYVPPPLDCRQWYLAGLTHPDCPVARPVPATFDPLGGPLPPLVDDGLTGDWKVTLRGSQVFTDTGSRFEASIVPEASLTRHGVRGDITFTGSGELIASTTGGYRLSTANLGVAGEYALDSSTRLFGTAALTASQQAPDDISLGGTVATAPVIVSGGFGAGIRRSFGRLQFELGSNLFRDVTGPTVSTLGVTTESPWRNRTGLGFNLRTAYELTPIVSTFTELAATREFYDAASPSVGAFQDNWTYSGYVGVAASWTNGLSAEAALGYGLRRFDAAALGEVGATLYSARLSYDPGSRLALSAALQSSISPSGNAAGATARVDYALTLEARYLLLEWLTARARAEGSWASFPGTTDTETRYGAGVGLDWRLNRNFALNLDYGYSRSEGTAASSYAHRISAGLTLSR